MIKDKIFEFLIKEQIIIVMQEIIRWFGVVKIFVIDVVKLFGVSYGIIYRYYVSKKELFEGVMVQWLEDEIIVLFVKVVSVQIEVGEGI